MYSEESNASATGCADRFDIAKGTAGLHKALEISCASMDEIVFDTLHTRIDFIKMDAEGMEEEIIRGGKETILAFRPKMTISPHMDGKALVKTLKDIRREYKTIISNNIIYAW